METQDILDKPIGTKEDLKLKPARCKILGVEVKNKKNSGEAMKTPLLDVVLKHPDREESVKISKIKFEKNGKLEIVTTWIQLDEEQKFKKSSAVSELLRFLKVNTLKELTGKEVDTIEQSKEDTYLCIKAY